MSFERKPGGSTRTSALTSGPASEPTPGRSTLTHGMVQMKIKAGKPATGEQVKAAAAEGVAGSAGGLPFLSLIQKSFGRHDVSSVRAHTDSAAAAGARAMGAEAYASGSSVAFGAAPDLHTAAHEAAHIVQQRSVLALTGGVGAAGDAHEQNADAVADRVVAGESAEDLLDRYTSGGPSAPVVQQKITTSAGAAGGKPTVYVTWKSIKAPKFTHAQIDASRAVREEFRANLLAVGTVMEDARFETVWNKISGEGTDADAFDIDDTTGRAALLGELDKRYASSARSADKFGRNQRDINVLISPTMKAHQDLEKKVGGRNTMMVKKPMGTAPARKPVTPADRAQQTQTHLSTVTHHTYAGAGEESQSALRLDQLGLITSTNNDATNALLAQDAQSRDDLGDMAARLAVAHGIGSMSREEAMANRVMRHALKLITRLEQTLDAKVKVTVPDKSSSGQDGVHAEIRIYQHDDFDTATHHMPSGTKVPCAGCYLYFVAEGDAIGVYMGPMWLTEAALSQQLKGTKLGTIDDKNSGQLATIAEQIKQQYEAAIAQGGHMVESWVRGGGHTTQTNADSESDLDDDEFEAARLSALARGRTAPRSGIMPTKGKPAKLPKDETPKAKKPAKKPARKPEPLATPLSANGFGQFPAMYATPWPGGSSHSHPPNMQWTTGASSASPPLMPPSMAGMPPSMAGMGMSQSPIGGWSMPPQLSSPQPSMLSSPYKPSTPSSLQPQPSSPQLPTSSSSQPNTSRLDPFAPLLPMQPASPLLGGPWSPQVPTPQLTAPSSSSSDTLVQQLAAGFVSALSQPPTPLDPDMVLGGQLSFMDTLAPTGIGNVVDLQNASGAANNCLINSIADALRLPPVSILTLASIRIDCGGEANRFLGRADVPTILRHLKHAARVVLIETADVIGDGTAPFSAVIIEGAGPEIYIVNAHDLHFGWCRPKPGFKAVVGANTVTFTPIASSQSPPRTRPASPLPPMAFMFGRDGRDADSGDDHLRRSSPAPSTKLPVWSLPSSSSGPAPSRTASFDLGQRQSTAKRERAEASPPPLVRAATDLAIRPSKMQRGLGMRGGLSRGASMRGGASGSAGTGFSLPHVKKRLEIDPSLDEQDEDMLPDVEDFVPEPKRQDRKSHDDEDDGGSRGWFDS